MIICFFLLAGCGEWRWASNQKNIAQLNGDIQQCRMKAFEKFPPDVIQQQQYNPWAAYNNQQVKNGEYRKTNTRCYTNPYTGITSCDSVERTGNDSCYWHIPEYQTVSVDLNQSARDSVFNQCMCSESWELKYFSYFWLVSLFFGCLDNKIQSGGTFGGIFVCVVSLAPYLAIVSGCNMNPTPAMCIDFSGFLLCFFSKN